MYLYFLCIYKQGFDEDSESSHSWNNYANEVGNWNNRSNNSQAPSHRRHSGGGGGGGGSNAHCVLMRGLPFKANENDIRKVNHHFLQNFTFNFYLKFIINSKLQ